MTRRRFSRLEYALRALRTPNSNNPAPAAPAGSVLANYQEVASGSKTLTYNRSDASKPEQILQTSVLPFFFGGADGSETLVAISKRVDDANQINDVQSACNQITPDLEQHSVLRNFIPAKAVVFLGTGATSQETSQITGLRYEKRGGASYTLPYGASTTERAEGNVRQDILLAVNLIDNASVSFSSERI